MLMRRAGSTPSHRLTLAFHTAPATGGRRDSSSKFAQGIAASRRPSLVGVSWFVQGAAHDGRDRHPGGVEALEQGAAVVIQVVVEHAARVHLEPVVHGFLLGIRIDEDLHRIVAIGGIVALEESRRDIRIIDIEADVERLRVPEQASRGLLLGAGLRVPQKLQADWRRGLTPRRLVELAVNRRR